LQFNLRIFASDGSEFGKLAAALGSVLTSILGVVFDSIHT